MSNRLNGLAASLLILLLLAGAGSARAAEQAPTLMVLLDGSGSMWGRVGSERRAKFDFTREILAETLARIRPDVRLGLASFGHRRKGNCADAEVLVSPNADNLEQVLGPLARINATGKGPLVRGLREAAAAVGDSTPATIVLIHDDVDNCGQDVCSTAADIAGANPGLVVHTIGLGLEKSKLQQMSCVPRLTGGKLFNAQDAAGVRASLDHIIELAHLEPGAEAELGADATPAAKAVQPPPNAEPGLYLSAGLGAKSATLDSPVRWRITKDGAGGELVRDIRRAVAVEKLPPGTYDVEAQLGLANARQTVDVKADTPTPLRINLNAGVLKMVARAAKGAAPLQNSVFTVTPLNDDGSLAGAPIWIGREAQPEVLLPAGTYRVTAENGLTRQAQTVKIAPATGTTFDTTLAIGRLELSAARGTTPDASNPIQDGVTYIIYRDDPDAPLGRREVARSASPSPAFTLPARTYYVTAKTSGAEAREQIAIGPGDVVRRTLPLALSRLELSATLDGKDAPEGLPLAFTISQLGGEPREVIRTTVRQPDLELSAGTYRLQAALGTTNVKSAADITLAAGQTSKVAMQLAAGHVTLKRATASPTGGSGIFWEIKDEQGHAVLRTSQPQPTVLLAPGRYVASFETRDRPVSTTFELKAGEDRTVEIGG